jgi:aspartate carbamoyltransferase catalytic subunit
MGADAVVIRHGASGAPRTLATSGWISAGVVNAGDGTHEHPTQALLDAFTIRKRLFGDNSRGRGLDGIRVTIVGDVLHSRVARSNVWLLHTLGAHVTLVAPPTLVPQDVSRWPVEVDFDLDHAIAAGPDALMMLRIQLERMSAAYFPTEREYSRRYGLDARRLQALPGGSIVLHPGPMNRGLEISAEAADSPRSTVLEQVTNGVSVRMAVLYLLLAGERPDTEKEDLR